MSGFVVREAAAEELDAAGRLVADAYMADGALDDHDRWYLDRIRDARGRALHCPILVAARDPGGELLGCVTYVPGAGNQFADLEVEGEAGFRMLGVASAARGRGVGRALVEACLARARADGRSGLAISTGPEMATAHRLYRRLGFRRAPERDFEPVPGVRLWVFVLAL